MEKYVAFRLDEEIYEKLKKEADDTASSVSRLLRFILMTRYKNN